MVQKFTRLMCVLTIAVLLGGLAGCRTLGSGDRDTNSHPPQPPPITEPAEKDPFFSRLFR